MKRLMTASEVAEYIKCDVRTVYRYAKNGYLPCYRIGTAIRFKQNEVEEAMKGAKNGETRC